MEKMVIIANLVAPTVEGSRFKQTLIADKSMSIEDAHKWAESRTGSAVLESVEISVPCEIKEL